jgi:hypothetical protein
MRYQAIVALLLLLAVATCGSAQITSPVTRLSQPKLLLPVRPAFSIAGISSLAAAMGIAGSTAAAGADPYGTGTGVVLDVCHPYSAISDSTLTVRNAMWDMSTSRAVAANDPQAALICYETWGDGNTSNICEATFLHLPSGSHTYVLSIGTSASAQALSVRAGGYYSTYPLPMMEAPQLVDNRANGEVRALITLNIPETAAAETRWMSVVVWAKKLPNSTASYVNVFFHHVQLARLD